MCTYVYQYFTLYLHKYHLTILINQKPLTVRVQIYTVKYLLQIIV